jgi:hypothetical protein
VSLLLDTHIVLWWLADDPTLADDIKDRLDQEADIYVTSPQITGSTQVDCRCITATHSTACW